MLQDLHLLGDSPLTLDFFVQVFLRQRFDGDEVTSQLVLGDADFAESSLTQLVADSVEVWRCHDWLAKLVELVDYHRHYILLILQ